MLTLLILLGSLLVLFSIVAAFVWTWRKLRPKGPGRVIFIVAFAVFAGLLLLACLPIEGGWVVVPILGGLVLIWCVLPRKKPWRLIYVVLLMIVYAWIFEAEAYDSYRWGYTCNLSSGFLEYHVEHGELTNSLEDTEIMYRGRPVTERTSLTAFGDSWGPAPIYLRADRQDIIVALIPPTRQQPRWVFISLMTGPGKGSVHWATEEDLAGILEADDLERAELGEPGRWADINWRD